MASVRKKTKTPDTIDELLTDSGTVIRKGRVSMTRDHAAICLMALELTMQMGYPSSPKIVPEIKRVIEALSKKLT